MQDTTLLDRSKPITMDGLRAFFREHDFSAQTSGYKFERASSEKNQIYIKTKGLFRKAWNQQMKSLTGKGSLINFSSDAPVRCLEESEEKLVAGTVMEILGNEPYAEKLIDQVLTSMRKPMNTEIEKFAQARGKTTADLTEEEFRQAVDAFADEFLARMMKLLLQVQNVPELMDFMSQDAAHEDFDEDVYRNYDKITREEFSQMQETQKMQIYHSLGSHEKQVEYLLRQDGKTREKYFSDLSRTLFESLRDLNNAKERMEQTCRKWVIITAAVSVVSSTLACVLCLLLAG